MDNSVNIDLTNVSSDSTTSCRRNNVVGCGDDRVKLSRLKVTRVPQRDLAPHVGGDFWRHSVGRK
jgi:hypothetical protein